MLHPRAYPFGITLELNSSLKNGTQNSCGKYTFSFSFSFFWAEGGYNRITVQLNDERRTWPTSFCGHRLVMSIVLNGAHNIWEMIRRIERLFNLTENNFWQSNCYCSNECWNQNQSFENISHLILKTVFRSWRCVVEMKNFLVARGVLCFSYPDYFFCLYFLRHSDGTFFKAIKNPETKMRAK